MSNIRNTYLKALEVINLLNINSYSPNNIGRKPKTTDIGEVALSLTAEFMSIDSENDLFRKVRDGGIPNLIERSQLNKRRRNLFGFAERIRLALSSRFTELEDYFIVDSMPLEICRTARQNRIKVCKENPETAPEQGFFASQNAWFYGYKLHGIRTISGGFHSVEITKANVHNIHYLRDVKEHLSDCVLLGDKGYLSATQQLDLFQSANILLETPMRTNQKRYKKQPYILRKSRKRIEMLFSQLCEQFMIRRNYVKTFGVSKRGYWLK